MLIDEYDKPMLDVLKGFYSVFKAADADLQFVLLTGVTKFAQVSVFNFILSGCFLTAARHLRAILLRRTVGDWLIA